MQRADRTLTARPVDVRGLARIDLEGLNALAARLTRVDRKYLLEAREAQRLVDHLAHEVRVLEHDGLTAFRYASVYFDTAAAGAGESYRAAATGRRRKVKIRTRSYLDSGEAMLEVKSATGRDESLKQRLPLATGTSAAGLGNGTDLPGGDEVAQFLREALDRAGSPLDPRQLRAVLRTTYTRTTLTLPLEAARLTIDTDLTWSDPRTTAAVSTPLVVVETKSGQAPNSADRHLWRLGHRPVRISKFAVGLSLLGLAPDAAPDNRWHRTLRILRGESPP